jgi:hypothetical protein
MKEGAVHRIRPEDPDRQRDFTPLDWVKIREPEILAVQIGHNHGLLSVGFSAEDKGITNGDPIHGGYFEQRQKLADGLAALPATVQTILVTMLPKVGATVISSRAATSRQWLRTFLRAGPFHPHHCLSRTTVARD